MILDPFATPILLGHVDDEALAGEITERLVREAASSPTVRRSIVGGWHGPPDLPARQDACWKALVRTILRGVRELVEHRAQAVGAGLPELTFTAQGWGTVLRAGGYSEPHDHADAHWSAVWYADPGDPSPAHAPTAGRLVFLDPRGAIGAGGPVDLFPRTCVVTPERGLLVVVPGWLTHHVHPSAGERPRVSVACNVMVRARSITPQPG